ncbi:cytochrome c1 [Limobrevibacterium gyesilva]|uniref:Cytochrome c1 n=1 Tax=Limobrevibacterium gyesilva TaxID=2991712 RepID=A0AA41YW52_9PROT|nr:cytochrome c1 [Limobrevibacterium gyesilva]MCW3477578.1 cytochrome c1 [Limobrevibacterium gyesilva]
MRLFPLAAIAALAAAVSIGPARAEEVTTAPLPHQRWTFDGPFGTYDRAAAQRGFQVYKEVCANCHSLKLGYYRDLKGIGLSDGQIAAIAASVSVPTIGEDGQPAERPGLPSDHFHSPFPNENAARAAMNGALPPDLSLIEKAREGGADYIYALLNGYSEPPAGMKLGDGMNYNKYFPGNQIAMVQPLQNGQVTYADGTPATQEQMARDVATFLTYMASPEMEDRKRIGVKIVLFLVFMTGITYAVKRKVWADVHH